MFKHKDNSACEESQGLTVSDEQIGMRKNPHLTLKQWLCHVKHWGYGVLKFPFPWLGHYDLHMYNGRVNSAEMTCLLCGATYVDKDEIDFLCPHCASPIKFAENMGHYWECSSKYCVAGGSVEDLLAPDEFGRSEEED